VHIFLIFSILDRCLDRLAAIFLRACLRGITDGPQSVYLLVWDYRRPAIFLRAFLNLSKVTTDSIMRSIIPMQNICTLLHMLSHGPCYFMDMVSEEVLSSFQASCHRFESDPGLTWVCLPYFRFNHLAVAC